MKHRIVKKSWECRGAFVDTVFEQLKEGRKELAFGFSEVIYKANYDVIEATFNKMNPRTMTERSPMDI